MRVSVVGAGVSGLTCAVALQDAGHEVLVVTAEPPPATVSAVAGAAWYPIRGERDARADRWLRRGHERFLDLARRPGTGVVLRRALELLREPADDAWWRDILPGFAHVPAPAGYVDAWASAPIPVLDMSTYLGWLVRRVRARGRIVVRRLDDLLQAPGEVIVNCTGLGSSVLAADRSVQPIRGQVVRVEQVGLDTMLLDEADPAGVTYVIPRARDIVLGGVRDAGNDDRALDAAAERAIVARCAALEPRLREARVVSRAAGLRPGRPSVRLELEERDGRAIVHDYGHASAGVTLSWGCAADVVDLVSAARA